MNKSLLIAAVFLGYLAFTIASAGAQTPDRIRADERNPGTISGTCFEDADRSGARDESEGFLEGIPVSISRLLLGLIPIRLGSVMTDSAGRFEFKGLRPGRYQVEITAGDNATQQTTTKNPVRVRLGPLQPSASVNFGLYREDSGTSSTTTLPDNATSTTTSATDNATSTTTSATDNATSTTTTATDNATSTTTTTAGTVAEKIGVLFVIHGGMQSYSRQYVWEGLMQIFSYETTAFQLISEDTWEQIFSSATTTKLSKAYEFEFGRIGGTDAYYSISQQQMEDLESELSAAGDAVFEMEWAAYSPADREGLYPYPRFIYNTEGDPDGPWSGYDPESYNVDGPVERLLAKGVSRVILVDLLAGGPRSGKTYDVMLMTRRALDDWNAENSGGVALSWANDPDALLEQSYPTLPLNWTSFGQSPNPPLVDPSVPLSSGPNPVAADTRLAALHVEGIEAALSGTVPDNETGVLLFNNALQYPYDYYFDPKIDDTLTLCRNIESQLLARHPAMSADNIVGGWMGTKEGSALSRSMRGETSGYAYLYESGGSGQLPSGKWGSRYWAALETLKENGVKHIVVATPQMVADSVLNLVEVPNQIGKEIGIKGWTRPGSSPHLLDPFADYWGIWAGTDCGGQNCCFEMGGCSDGRPYPPPAQLNLQTNDGIVDPSLAYDLSAYGHLGYDETGGSGAPDPDNPVQDQYAGTWAMEVLPNADSRLAEILAEHVLDLYEATQ